MVMYACVHILLDIMIVFTNSVSYLHYTSSLIGIDGSFITEV